MNTYLLVHRHPVEYAPDANTNARWEAWFEELGESLVDLGNPVLGGRSCVADAGAVLPLGGYTIIEAEDVEAATILAGSCPIIDDGGAVEVGQLTPVPGREHPARTF